MSDSESNFTDDSEYNYIPGYLSLPLNFEVEDATLGGIDDTSTEIPSGPYQDEPLAGPEWLKEYKKKKEIEDNLRKELEARIAGGDASEWWVSTSHKFWKYRCFIIANNLSIFFDE